MKHAPQAAPRRILRREAVLERTGLGKTSQYELERSGRFPTKVALSPRLVGWYEDEVEAWISSRRDSPVPRAFTPSTRPRAE
jgi:prophage regulatory protein